MHVRALLGALLGPLLALLASEAVLHTAWWDAQVLKTSAGTADHARALLRTHRDAEIVVTGSSVALIDVRPDQLEARLGRRVVNAGVLAASLASTWMAADELLATDAKTFVLVVAASDLAAEVPPRRLRRVEVDEAVALFGWEHAVAHRDRYLDWGLGDVSLAWRQRHLPREVLAGSEAVHPRDKPRDTSADARALLLREKHADLAWATDSPDATALRRLARRMRAEGRDLVVVPAPQDPRITGEPVRREVLALLSDLARDEPFELVVPTRWPVWRPAHFRDAVHLGVDGQRAFTDGLAAALERR